MHLAKHTSPPLPPSVPGPSEGLPPRPGPDPHPLREQWAELVARRAWRWGQALCSPSPASSILGPRRGGTQEARDLGSSCRLPAVLRQELRVLPGVCSPKARGTRQGPSGTQVPGASVWSWPWQPEEGPSGTRCRAPPSSAPGGPTPPPTHPIPHPPPPYTHTPLASPSVSHPTPPPPHPRLLLPGGPRLHFPVCDSLPQSNSRSQTSWGVLGAKQGSDRWGVGGGHKTPGPGWHPWGRIMELRGLLPQGQTRHRA